jgi:hypothetical protein
VNKQDSSPLSTELAFLKPLKDFDLDYIFWSYQAIIKAFIGN